MRRRVELHGHGGSFAPASAKVLDLAFPDKFLCRAGNVFDWNFRVNAMLIEEIQSIDFQTLERCLGHLLDVLGAAVEGIPLAAFGWIGL